MPAVTSAVDQNFSFAPYTFNSLAANDFDADEILNEDDNCPTIGNKNQAEADGDNIGDKCDNAKDVKNYSQSDVDNDGVADIIDNCKLAANPDQKDKDKDEVGDECDGAYGKDNALSSSVIGAAKGTSFPFVAIIIVLSALVVAGFVLVGKKK